MRVKEFYTKEHRDTEAWKNSYLARSRENKTKESNTSFSSNAFIPSLYSFHFFTLASLWMVRSSTVCIIYNWSAFSRHPRGKTRRKELWFSDVLFYYWALGPESSYRGKHRQILVDSPKNSVGRKRVAAEMAYSKTHGHCVFKYT